MKTSIKTLFQLFALSVLAGCATQSDKVERAELAAVVLEEPAAPADKPANQTDYSQINATTPGTVIQTGRYTAVPAAPTLSQRDPLQVVINVTIPNDLTTVGHAVHYVLRRSGYAVESPPKLHPDALRMFLNPLPDIQRHLGPMTLRDALTVLVTPELVPVVDPIRRRINYVPAVCRERKW